MRKKIWTAAALLVLTLSTHAQKGKGGSGDGSAPSTPAGSSGPSSATGTQQTGYVYRLPWRYHLRYASDKKRVNNANVGNRPPVGNVDQGVKRTITKRVLKGSETVEIHQQHQDVPDQAFDDHDVPFTNPDPLPGDLTGYTVTNHIIDSVSRYWDRPKKWFHRYRLRVAITQADSGKLQVGVYERGFGLSNHPFDAHYVDWTDYVRGEVHTPDYAIPIGASDSAQNFYLQLDNKIIAGQPISYIKLRYASSQYGAMVIPYKYRFAPTNTKIYVAKPQSTRYSADTVVSAPSESTGNINLAVYLGRKWGYTRFYFDQTKTHNTLAFMASAFAGFSLVPLSVSTVKYPKDADSLPSQAIAITGGLAASLEWRGIDLGVFLGKDFTAGKNEWIYNKKTWVGFGIGVNLGMFTSGPTQIQL